MIRGIFCLNSECKHYFEDNCMHILEKDTITISNEGKCKTFEKGIHIGYEQEDELKFQQNKNCSTCEYWIKKYQQCEHPDQRNDESGAYDSPPTKHCELWELATD